MMKNRSLQIISLILAIIISLSTVSIAAVDSVAVFKDNKANYLKYISGFGDGTIRPDSFLTRAQCAKMLSNVIDLRGVDGECGFSDVPSDFWAHDEIVALNSAGVIVGYGDNYFKPDAYITRAEFSTIITRIIDVEEGSSRFRDTKGHWAEKNINSLSSGGFLGGYADNTFRPNSAITRAEAVKIINKVIGNSVNEAEKRELFTDLPVTHWAYYEIMAAISTTAFDSPIKHVDFSFNDIEYIEINVEEIESELNDILDEFVTAPVERQVEIFNRVSAVESDVALAIAMSNINSNRNVTSVKDRNNISNAVEAQNIITKAKEKRYKYLSVVKSREVFEEKIGLKIEEIPKPDEAAPERLVSLMAEEQKYENEFNTFMYESSIVHNGKKYSLSQAEYSSDPLLYAKALQYYVDNRIEYGTIFTNLISVRTRIANFYGYRYYTDLGYMRARKFYYTPEDLATIRQDVKKYIAPLYFNITKAAQGYDNGYCNLNKPTVYTTHNKTALDVAQDFLRQLSPQTREALMYLNNYDLIDYEVRENKATTAFTTYISEYEMPFVFLNETGGASDIENFCHEFGHAFQAFRVGSDGVECPPDVAEIASYGMEMLSLHNYAEFYGEDSAKKEQLINFYYKLHMLLLTTFMDEFQYMVYKDTFLTIDERNSLYARLYKEYFIGSNFSHPAYTKGIVWTNPTHIYNEPYYSIDYTLAMTVAFQLWEIGENEGFDKQFEAYMGIIESPYINTSSHSVALSAGMDSPFKKGVIESIAKKLDNIFKIQN